MGNAIFFPVFDYVAKNKWAQYALLFIAAVATLGIYLALRDNDVRKRDRERIAAKQAEVRIAVNERSTQIINEERSHADAAIEARDHSPDFPSSDVVPDPIARVIFRD